MKMKSLDKRNVTWVEINIKKEEMYTKARHLGMTHLSIVECSQELDVLLNQFQGIHQYDYVG
ncbi:MAG: aspartyl-phosphate phosphatase Spo0E family protein [Paenisporosarcina sp.]